MHRKTRREVDDFDDVVRVVAEAGDQNGGVALVILVRLPDFVETDVDMTVCRGIVVGLHQPAADGIAVEGGVTPPDDTGVSVDQGAGARIADQAKFQ